MSDHLPFEDADPCVQEFGGLWPGVGVVGAFDGVAVDPVDLDEGSGCCVEVVVGALSHGHGRHQSSTAIV